MTSYRKNIVVGLTVLGSLLVLGFMILKFGDAPAKLFTEDQMPISMVADRAQGVNGGSPVYYRGVNVGKIIDVRLAPDGPKVLIDALIETRNVIPANVVARIRTQGLIGASAAINLEVPPDVAPSGRLAAGATLKAEFVGLEVLPPEFAALAKELTALSRQMRESNVVTHTDEAIVSLRGQIEKAGKLIESVDAIVADPQMKSDLKAALANVRDATATANRIGAQLEKTSAKLDAVADSAQSTLQKAGGGIDRVTDKLEGRLEQIAKILETTQSITAKIDQGKGTAGLLVNDPKLYAALVESTQTLNATIGDLRRLVQQWEQEGAALRLN